MAQDKVRVYALARELDMESKDLLELCQQANIDVKNQLSSLDPEQRDAVVELVRRRNTKPAAPSAPPPTSRPSLAPPPGRVQTLPVARRPGTREGAPEEPVAPPTPAPPTPRVETPTPRPVPPSPPEKVPTLPTPPTRTAPAAATPAPPTPAVPPVVKPTTPPEQPRTPVVSVASQPVAPKAPDALTIPKAPETPAAASTPPAVPAPEPPVRKSETAAPPRGEPTSTRPPTPPPTTPRPTPTPSPTSRPGTPLSGSGRPSTGGGVPTLGGGGGNRPLPNLGARRTEGGEGSGSRPQQQRSGRPLPGHRPGLMKAQPTPTLSKPKPTEGEKKPAQTPGSHARKISDIPPELMGGDRPITIEDLLRPPTRPGATPTPAAPVTEEEEEDQENKAKRPGEVAGRKQRHQERSLRAKDRQQARGELKQVKLGVAIDELERPSRSPGRIRSHKQQRQPAGPKPRKGKVPIELPITVRSLSEAIGVRSGDLLFKLMGHGAPPNININSVLDPDLAETMAIEYSCELDVKRPVDVEQQAVAETEKPDRPEDLVPRAPIVTIMGHVDHGKTSLLDKIRQSNVVATEAGGITQVLRAWRVDHGGRPITFLDTPGHEAFTKMRARGANVTDIAVIVVAADDGVMPQTEEAISHAKAAGVSIVVAINKIDLPNANLRRTEQQLYGLGLIPDNMGGDIPFVHTSAATGKGIDDLLDNISVVAELKELKANPQKPANGTCLEASVSEGEGVFATVLVQNGTLHRGDVVLCGASYGRVRAIYDDMGRPIQEAGPSVPARFTGLDEVPNADDPFMVVPDLAVAREIAEKRRLKQLEAQVKHREPVRLETLSEAKIVELKVILKADVRGSLEAISKELGKLQHDEVRVRILHTGIGGITESDVTLALTSPGDTIIVGFNVVPDDRARALAEDRGVQIRQYNIIYNLTDDIRAALEGKLKPREDVVHLGRAVVRETFKISRVGTIAGCYVTQGTIERSAKVRVIRAGIVVYPPADRTVGLDSLKRFKEDVREVQQGYECGIKIAGYDDIKVDDVIEAYRIEQVQRTLD